MRYKKKTVIRLKNNVEKAQNDLSRIKAHIEFNQYKIDTEAWGNIGFYEERNRKLILYLNKINNYG